MRMRRREQRKAISEVQGPRTCGRAVALPPTQRCCLARYFGGDAQSWLNLQTLYDLRLAEKANASKIDREVTPLASTAA
jgi:plasmid maintenance system antidote protein VapI